MREITIDSVPNEILTKILLYVINPHEHTTIYRVAKRWYEICRDIHPRWSKLKEVQEFYYLMDIYRLDLLKKVIANDTRSNATQMRYIRSLFSDYKNCNITMKKISEIMIRISKPNESNSRNRFSMSYVLLLHFDSFDFEIHTTNDGYRSAKIVDVLKCDYKPMLEEELLDLIKQQLEKYFSRRTLEKSMKLVMAKTSFVSRFVEEIKSFLSIIVNDICTKKWLNS